VKKLKRVRYKKFTYSFLFFEKALDKYLKICGGGAVND